MFRTQSTLTFSIFVQNSRTIFAMCEAFFFNLTASSFSARNSFCSWSLKQLATMRANWKMKNLHCHVALVHATSNITNLINSIGCFLHTEKGLKKTIKTKINLTQGHAYITKVTANARERTMCSHKLSASPLYDHKFTGLP